MIKVYHHESMELMSRPKLHEVLEAFNEGKHHLVAEVQTDNLEIAYQQTNHITRPWYQNPDVTDHSSQRGRSTSIGDVLEHDGEMWLVAPVGFERLA
jgi:hypothetical protein